MFVRCVRFQNMLMYFFLGLKNFMEENDGQILHGKVRQA
jgi:hypothetical protein